MSALFNMTGVSLDRVELAAVLTGLRMLQSELEVPTLLHHILTDCGEFDPITEDQIDALCDRLNGGEVG
ncbi:MULTISPECIES: hypothetical protein [Roseobacteraceae]|uniref:hypothetical protein n=1 Tax=Roseobacteraceae TaxID=2854170 RepID=UPI0022BBE03A|nr:MULTISPECIES: hypothetical protein [Roseobacteraceae]MCZ4354887.1 hypothetical protein [Roseovarius aestuarii]